MKIMIATLGENVHEGSEGELAGSPHRQISHTLVALPVGTTIVLTVPDDDPVTYHSEED